MRFFIVHVFEGAKLLKKPQYIIVSFLLLVLFSTGCKDKAKHPNQPVRTEVPDMALQLPIRHFEKAIFDRKVDFDSLAIQDLRKEYGSFFDIWCYRLAGFIAPGRTKVPDAEIAVALNRYRNDKYIRLVYEDCSKAYPDMAEVQKELEDVFKRYSEAFPGRPTPKLITYVSPFTSNVMAMDSVLGIGLHFYLGSDYKYYPSLQLPQYMIKKFRREYIIPDAVRGWIDSEYSTDSSYKDFLHQMVYEGKLLYAADVLIPDLDDTLKIGYSAAQLNWAYANESKIWSAFIGEQIIYSRNPGMYMKFINDGNTTSGFPKEAPSKLGPFIGWQIVRSFMKNHPDLKPADLFRLQDAQLILSQSSYKPSKAS